MGSTPGQTELVMDPNTAISKQRGGTENGCRLCQDLDKGLVIMKQVFKVLDLGMRSERWGWGGGSKP